MLNYNLDDLLNPLCSVDSIEATQTLALLDLKVKSCHLCKELASTRTQTVFGVGSTSARLCFVGEAPGADEDRRGEPFVGAAGQLLDRILSACKLSRKDVYICNVLKCRPPANRKPAPEEEAHCLPFLEKQIAALRPLVICTLGGVAANALLKTTTPVTRMRGKTYTYKGIPVICTFHPAYLLRNPEKKRDVWEDMQQVIKLLAQPASTELIH
jgi:DNA polymerase